MKIYIVKVKERKNVVTVWERERERENKDTEKGINSKREERTLGDREMC
jgi:hypothetical protein